VFAGGRLAHPELLGDQEAADAVAHEITVDLRREVSSWLFEPGEDLQTALVRQRV
jgi:hypothetical protein